MHDITQVFLKIAFTTSKLFSIIIQKTSKKIQQQLSKDLQISKSLGLTSYK